MKRKFAEGEQPSSSSKWIHLDDDDTRVLIEHPKPALVVSHSGAHRLFAEHLCWDLEAVGSYSVYFNKESDSVAKGEESGASTLRVAEACRLGILLLSEDFFTVSKWPMMELATLVASREKNKKQGPAAAALGLLEPRLLPVYYKLSRPEFKKPSRQAKWLDIWREWVKEDPRIDVNAWKTALIAIDQFHGIVPELLRLKDDDAIRREIVKRVADFNLSIPQATASPLPARAREMRVVATHHFMNPPAASLPLAADGTPLVVAGDGSRIVMPSEGVTVHGVIRICEEINGLFSKEPDLTQKVRARVLGIHGMSGMGKTTISKSLCNSYGGKVCHLELKTMVLLELLKKVLKDLSIISQQSLDRIGDADQAWNALEVYMKHQDKVFLVIDNIWDEEYFIPERFLKMEFTPGSKVLLIARHMAVLQSAGVPVTCCKRMPFLREAEAMGLFIQGGGCEMIDEKDQANVRKWVSHCCYGSNNTNFKRFHPLAVKALAEAATAVMGRKPSKWTDDNLNRTNQSGNNVFDVLRIGYQLLDSKYRAAFVSLILFTPDRDFASIKPRMSVHSVENVCQWLAIVLKMIGNEAPKFLQVMEAKTVVEKWQDASNVNLKIHDLYREFAEYELLQGQYRVEHRIFRGDLNVPEALKMEKPDVSQRSVLYELSKELRMVKVENCTELKAINLECMNLLRSLVVEGCAKLEKICGIQKLVNLAWLQWRCCNLMSLVDVPLSSELQVLWLEGGGTRIADFVVCKPPEVNLCKGMKEIMMTKFPQLEKAPELSNLICLETLVFNGCERLKYIPDLSVLSSCLRSLHLTDCASLERIPGLENLTALLHLVLFGCRSLMTIPDLQQVKKLEYLDLSATGIPEIPGIHALLELEELHLDSCDNLLKFPDLLSLPKLKKIFWRGYHVGRDGVKVSESMDTGQAKRKFGEVSDDDQASEKNSGEDSDGETSEKDDEDEAESEQAEEGEDEDASAKEEDEGAADDEEYGDGDGDDEDSTDTDSDGDSG